jgi:hypothetical protein
MDVGARSEQATSKGYFFFAPPFFAAFFAGAFFAAFLAGIKSLLSLFGGLATRSCVFLFLVA